MIFLRAVDIIMNKTNMSSALQGALPSVGKERMIKSNQQINKQVISDCDGTERM